MVSINERKTMIHPVERYKELLQTTYKAYKKSGEATAVQFEFDAADVSSSLLQLLLEENQQTAPLRLYYVALALDGSSEENTCDYVEWIAYGDGRLPEIDDYETLVLLDPSRFSYSIHFLPKQAYEEAIETHGDTQSDTTMELEGEYSIHVSFASKTVETILAKMKLLA